MIRAIAAVDDRLGVATDTGIPWNVQADMNYFRATTVGTQILMGFATYVEFAAPLPDTSNLVATKRTAELRPGFRAVNDVDQFLERGTDRDLWVIGGATLYAITLHYVEQIYLTRVEGDYHCTKFFPDFREWFELVSDNSSPPVADTPTIRFQVWDRSSTAPVH